MPKGPWYSKAQLESKEPGLSGADKVGAPPVEGVNNPDGTPATTVMQMFRALIRRGSATAADLLASILTVDGAGSGLDADLLDGVEGSGYVRQTEKGQPNGAGTLDANGKQPLTQVNAALLGANRRQGTWDAQTNTPNLGAMALDPVADLGKFWEVSVSGNRLLAGESQADWNAGDYAIWEGAGWGKIDNTDKVGSVEGRTGAVTLSDLYADINDPRLRQIRDEGAALANRAALDFTGDGVIVTDDGPGGRTQVNISGAAAGAASEVAAGIGEIATDTEIQTVLSGSAFRNFLVSAYRVRQELDRRFTPEAVHAVGAAGEPAFQGAWVAFGAGYEAPGFYKDPFGRVHLRGAVKSVASGTNIFTLPAGYRPPAPLAFAVDGAGGAAAGVSKCEVNADGTVVATAVSGNTRFSLNGISFRV